jgi:hypothetical protein
MGFQIFHIWGFLNEIDYNCNKKNPNPRHKKNYNCFCMFLRYDIVIRLGASLSLSPIHRYRPKLYLNIFYPHFQIYWTFHNHFLGELVPKPNLNK